MQSFNAVWHSIRRPPGIFSHRLVLFPLALFSFQDYDKHRYASSVIRSRWQAYAVIHSVPQL